jgi:two-component system, NarL family, response regulator LiaR
MPKFLKKIQGALSKRSNRKSQKEGSIRGSAHGKRVKSGTLSTKHSDPNEQNSGTPSLLMHAVSQKRNPNAIRVMVVDDHAVVRQGIKMFMSLDKDIRVVGEAQNGQEACELTAALKPDIVLMDIIMPKMDGLTAIQKIKMSQPEVEIIALTSILEDDKVFKAIHAGAMGYLMKDTTADALAKAIKSASRGEVQLDPEAAKCLIREVRTPESPEKLTERETEVLRLIAKGLSNRAIAAALVVSEKTVKTHVRNVLSKLRLLSRTQAALYALMEGLVTLDETNMGEANKR